MSFHPYHILYQVYQLIELVSFYIYHPGHALYLGEQLAQVMQPGGNEAQARTVYPGDVYNLF